MAIIPITESGLTFNIERNRLYRPENEAFYKKLCSKHPIKICDLMYLQQNFPALLQSNDALKRKMRLVLIVKDHKNEWCLPLKDALSKICTPLEKAFSLEATQVFNQDLARTKLGLDITE